MTNIRIVDRHPCQVGKTDVISFTSSQRRRQFLSVVSYPPIICKLVVFLMLSASCCAFSPISNRMETKATIPQHTRWHSEDSALQRLRVERPLFFANGALSETAAGPIASNLFTTQTSSSSTSLFSSRSQFNNYPLTSNNAIVSLAFASNALSKSCRGNGGVQLFGAATDGKEEKKLSPFQRAVSGVWKAITSVLRFFFVKPLLWLKSLFSGNDVSKKEDEIVDAANSSLTEDVSVNVTSTDAVVTEAAADVKIAGKEELVEQDIVAGKIDTEDETAAEELVTDLQTNKDTTPLKAGIEKETVVQVEEDEETYLTTTDNLAVDEDANITSTDPSLVGDELPYYCYEVKDPAASKATKRNEEIVATPVLEGKTAPEKVDEIMEKEEDVVAAVKVANPVQMPLPKGERWAVSNPAVDLSGDWKVVVSDEFKNQYDAYLRNLGQPQIVRSVALSIIGMTREHTAQSHDGRELYIKGTNARGIWERTLRASGSDFNGVKEDEIKAEDDHKPVSFSLVTADSEKVQAEAWWEENGTVHISWLRGGKKYGGGDFESKRYLEDDGKILVCESKFHPWEEGREKATVTWKFERTP